ncbi:HlyD family efflux transporter periplasmic adaptor subunit [Dyadobacter frigoris]|uniref:HlyD family efflux transporter periplasmic adaptor subunit n=1 Tax=Dyadobacter frigoris TaxID=2576211 RepID=A0A4U6D3A1_9BACT|nr:HlyD family efflux transporter periplasmic adaptor subunit [Dyadobacter frigoris]TKT91789.1 HlyD family efflux transporter periplasmic adaptor subunit [Dyadobacter frigoris]GLU55561.1 hemolysin D [Dyadobacter frigoris]
MEDITEKNYPRTEEIQDIIERMPTKFGSRITLLILLIITLILFFGWQVRYPDIVSGQVTINANQAPLKLVAMGSGKLQLKNIKSQDGVKENQVIAYIENSADVNHVSMLSEAISKIKFPIENAPDLYESLPREISAGELSSTYFSFLNAVKQLSDYHSNRSFDQQTEAFQKLILQQQRVLMVSYERSKISSENQRLYRRFFDRDSTLLRNKVVSKADFDLTKIKFVGAKDQYQSTLRDIANAREQVSQTESKIQETAILKNEKERQLDLELLTTYNDLSDKIKAWRQKYVFVSPFAGKVQFLKFWNNNQFIQTGEPIFTIVPKQEALFGQVLLPAMGSGKVKTGQEVIVKLEDYPYMEYGSITGKVNSISLTSNSVKTSEGDVETYLVTISFPEELKTNYGTKLQPKFEMKGSAEIITNDRRLIQRFFDNLKYVVKK